MKQEVSVLAVFNIGSKDPKPVKFKVIEEGDKKTVNVYSVLGKEYIGMDRIDYECNSLSERENLINYKLSYYRSNCRYINGELLVHGFCIYKSSLQLTPEEVVEMR